MPPATALSDSRAPYPAQGGSNYDFPTAEDQQQRNQYENGIGQIPLHQQQQYYQQQQQQQQQYQQQQSPPSGQVYGGNETMDDESNGDGDEDMFAGVPGPFRGF